MPNDSPPDEMRMRAALGLQRDPQQRPASHRSEQSLQRRRFVREGEVAVTMISSTASDTSLMESPRSRLMALEEALISERSSHARTKRSLDDALAAIKALETKHGHAELAYADAIENERSARAQTEAALQQLQAQLHEMEERARHLQSAAASQTPRAKRTAGPTARAVRRSKEASGAVEVEPVKWWLPNRQAGKRRR
jgi:chromosome segregation ATPase